MQDELGVQFKQFFYTIQSSVVSHYHGKREFFFN